MNAASPNIDPKRPVIRQLGRGRDQPHRGGRGRGTPRLCRQGTGRKRAGRRRRRIAVDYADGGKTLIRVTDDGCGMTGDDLPLALSRHATSKIDGSDLLDIHSFGFRGEALPSLGAVGRLTITGRAPQAMRGPRSPYRAAASTPSAPPP
jgi:DNA mismatch repair protein MutL